MNFKVQLHFNTIVARRKVQAVLSMFWLDPDKYDCFCQGATTMGLLCNLVGLLCANRPTEEQPGLKPAPIGIIPPPNHYLCKKSAFSKGLPGPPFRAFPSIFPLQPIGCLISATTWIRTNLNQKQNQGTIIVTHNQVKRREWLPQN